MNQPSTKQRPMGIRMKELSQKSGLPKSTILHYLEQGLLPQPVKTSPNMAYYQPDCVERLAFIREMQTRHRLPLASIKRLLLTKEQGHGVEHLAQLSQIVFGEDSDQPMDPREFCAQSGLKAGQLKELLAAGLLLPLTPGRYDQRDLALGQLYANALAQGVTCDDLSFYHRLGVLLVDEEMHLRSRITGHLPDGEDAEITGRLVQAARAMRGYVIDRIFQLRVAGSTGLKDPGLLGGKKPGGDEKP